MSTKPGELQTAIVSWSGECSGGLAHGEGMLTSDWVGTDRSGFEHRSKGVSKGQLQNGKKHGYWYYYYDDGGGGPNVKAEIVVYVKGEAKAEPNGLGTSDWVDSLR